MNEPCILHFAERALQTYKRDQGKETCQRGQYQMKRDLLKRPRPGEKRPTKRRIFTDEKKFK